MVDLEHIQLEPSWKHALGTALLDPQVNRVFDFVRQEKQQGKVIYPPGKLIFSAFDQCPFHQTKVVIIGQDPYHGVGQANGLCFSVNQGISFPPSLLNIFKELRDDLDFPIPTHGDLSAWAKQGVLLLNSVLTVEAGQAASHQGKGWEDLTSAVVSVLSAQREHVVFILWGNYAHQKGRMINTQKHCVLKAAHPSPLSANRGGFFGCKVFSKTNTYLAQHGLTPIYWQLP